MQARHTHRETYFAEQATTTRKHVLPFLERHMTIGPETRVLEIGCGEGGNLVPFVERRCREVVGMDLDRKKIENGNIFHEKWLAEQADKTLSPPRLEVCNVYDASPAGWGTFDLIFMRDTLEHIHDQARFMAFVHSFLKPTGKFFLGFPPWQNPFGGHQQMCKSRLLSKLPYFHLLPRPLYAGLMRALGESPQTVDALLEIQETRITIEGFERIKRSTGYETLERRLYLINPNYEVKFGLKSRLAPVWLSGLPWLRNFFITTNYYIIQHKSH